MAASDLITAPQLGGSQFGAAAAPQPGLGVSTSVLQPTTAASLGVGGDSSLSPNASQLQTYQTIANSRTMALGVSDYFLRNYDVNGTDWAKVYGYAFLIYRGSQKISQLPMQLNPTNISIDVPAATEVAVTMKGIVENHNGAPLRRISIRGTSGVMPNNGDADTLTVGTGSNGLLDYMFKNTIQSVNRVVNTATQISTTAQSLAGNNPTNRPPLNRDTTSVNVGANSGYIWTQALINFLDSYLALKKSRQNSGVRFQFQMYKDKMFWDCTLNSYSIRKMPGTLEYEYEINLTAWRRSPLVLAVPTPNNQLPNEQQQLNKIAQITSLLTNSRLLVAQSLGVLSGVQADITQSFIQPFNQLILLTKEIGGAVETLADFPAALVAGLKASVYSYIAGLISSNSQQIATLNQSFQAHGINATSASRQSQALPPQGVTTQALLDQQALGTSDLAQAPDTSSPVEQIFQNPQLYPDIFDQLPIDSLPMTPAQYAAVQTQRANVNAFTVNDLMTARDSVRSFGFAVSGAFGGANATYNRIMGLPAPTQQQLEAQLDIDSMILLGQINDIVQSFDTLINTINQQPAVPTNDYYNYYARLAQANAITFQNANSKFFVPMPYGCSMESLALQYLGDADRWTEIAALNGLQDPYIDEDGFTIPLITNAAGSTATITTAQNLYIGQSVQVQAQGLQTVFCVIASIETISDIEVVVQFANQVNLNGYTVAKGAQLFCYLPDTVNSNSMIAIPSQSPVNVPGNIILTPSPADLSYITYLAKVDFLLTSSGDLAMTSGGDILTAAGVQNLVQAANMKVVTGIATIVSNPGFGNPAQAGVSVADLSAADIVQALQSTFAQDPRFNGVLAAQAYINGPSAKIDLLVSIAGSQVNLPISTQLPL